MSDTTTTQNSKQELFRTMVLGILLYSVVLGFFNDYTGVFYASSYSTIFAVAVVMQLLTFATLKLKDMVAFRHKQRTNSKKYVLVLSIWLILFFSKFIFLAVIDIIFRQNVEISGFIGLLLIIACCTLVQYVVEYTYRKLAD